MAEIQNPHYLVLDWVYLRDLWVRLVELFRFFFIFELGFDDFLKCTPKEVLLRNYEKSSNSSIAKAVLIFF